MIRIIELFIFSILILAFDVQAACYKEIKSRLPSHGVVIFGEIHGTRELPAFFLDCVQEFYKNNERVQIFLEFPTDIDAILKEYVHGETSLTKFISEPHWRKNDGRASIAMLTLLKEIKNTEIGHLPIFAIDVSKYVENRDAEMMRNFMKNFSPDSFNLVLVGNLHAQLTAYRRGTTIINPFASLLKGEVKEVVSFRAAYPSGSAWVCTPDCGLKNIDENDGDFGEFPINNVYWGKSEVKYSGVFKVGSISASPPARNVKD